MKIRAPPGPTRMEVLQLVEIFRARVADVSERSITLCVTGDAGKARHALPPDGLPPHRAQHRSVCLAVHACLQPDWHNAQHWQHRGLSGESDNSAPNHHSTVAVCCHASC